MKSDGAILVCGGAGYIGAQVVRTLLEAGRQVVVIDDLSTGHTVAVPETVPLIRGSIGERALLDKVFAQYPIQSVIHLCASSLVAESVREPLKYYRNNVCNGLVLLESMFEHDIRSMVFSSTAAVYGYPQCTPITEQHPTSPVNPYGWSKLAFEQMLVDFGSAYGLGWVALRYFNAAGAAEDGSIGEDHRPESHLIPLVLKAALRMKRPELSETLPDTLKVFGSDYPTADGTCIRDYIHVEDLAQAHVLALNYLKAGRKSRVFNLGNGAGFSVKEVIETCRMVTGVAIEYELAQRRAGDPAELVSDSGQARDELGWNPKRAELAWIVANAWDFLQRFPQGFADQ